MVKTQIEREKELGFKRLTLVLEGNTFLELKILSAKTSMSMMDIFRIAINDFLNKKRGDFDNHPRTERVGD